MQVRVTHDHDSKNPFAWIFHKAARFFTSLAPTPPPIRDELFAEDHLLPAELDLWRRMCNQDRRHSAQVARRFVARRPTATRAEVAGALLHDVGKVDCGVGTFGRVVATVVGGRTDGFRTYLDHERVGAELVASIGSDPVTVELVAAGGPAFEDLRRSDHA